jgi:hypothetical protein
MFFTVSALLAPVSLPNHVCKSHTANYSIRRGRPKADRILYWMSPKPVIG